MCSAAELKFYFNSFFERSGSTNYLKPNKNCNLTSWVEGCEPGWACSVGLYQKVNLNDSKVIPARTLNCQACCEGFFCPHGLTCMIRKYLRVLNSSSFYKNLEELLIDKTSNVNCLVDINCHNKFVIPSY